MTLTEEQRTFLSDGLRVPYVTFRFRPGAEFALENVSVEAYSQGTYTGGSFSNGEPIIDHYKNSMMLNIGSLGDLQKLSSDEQRFVEAYTFLFTEFNNIIKTKAQEETAIQKAILEGNP